MDTQFDLIVFLWTSTDLDHWVATPGLHPLDRTLLVQRGVTLTVQGERVITTVHDQGNVQIGLDSCNKNI